MCLLSAFSSIFSSWNNRNNYFLIIQRDCTKLATFGCQNKQKKSCLTVHSMSESSSDGLRYSFLFLFLMGFRWSGLREETLPPAGTFSTAELLLRCRKQTQRILICSGVWFTFNITNAIKIDQISTCDLLNAVLKKKVSRTRERQQLLVSVWISAELLYVSPLSSGIVVLLSRTGLNFRFHRYEPLWLHSYTSDWDDWRCHIWHIKQKENAIWNRRVGNGRRENYRRRVLHRGRGLLHSPVFIWLICIFFIELMWVLFWAMPDIYCICSCTRFTCREQARLWLM